MEPQDRALIYQMSGNARMTYRELARIFSVSPNTIKTRINRMLKQGVIVSFFVCVSRAVLGSEYVGGFVYTDGSENMIE
ncbi:MAG: Lrp/AsnC family transcriptional regulator, partial [Candidatus Thorarchaeota archaeon]